MKFLEHTTQITFSISSISSLQSILSLEENEWNRLSGKLQLLIEYLLEFYCKVFETIYFMALISFMVFSHSFFFLQMDANEMRCIVTQAANIKLI